MTLDPRNLARRVILERLIIAGFVAVLIGIMVAAKVAWGQEADAASIVAAHPVELWSLLFGSGGATAVGGVAVAVMWVLNKAGIPVGVTFGKQPSTAPHLNVCEQLERRVDAIEKEQARSAEAQKHMGNQQTRTLLEVQGVRDLAQQILLRQMGQGGQGG